MRITKILLIGALAFQPEYAAAQKIMDKSQKSISKADKENLFLWAGKTFTDPYRIEFQRLSKRGSFICGEYNGPNDRGGHNGYLPFYLDLTRGTGALVPAIPSIEAQNRLIVAQVCG